MVQGLTGLSAGGIPEIVQGVQVVTDPQAISDLGSLKVHWSGLAAQDQEAQHPLLTPPDQALCVGNGYVLEAVNWVRITISFAFSSLVHSSVVV